MQALLPKCAICLALPLLACSTEPPMRVQTAPTPRSAPTIVPLSTASSSQPSVEEPARPAEAPVAPVPKIVELSIPAASPKACRIEGAGWSGRVQLRTGGPAFATVKKAPAAIWLGDPKEAAHLTVTSSFVLDAVVDHPPIYLAKPHLLGGFAVPLAGTSLEWEQVDTKGKIAALLDVSDVFAAPRHARSVVDCSALVIVETDYDTAAFIGGIAQERTSVRAGSVLEAAPGGDVLARMGDKSASAAVIASRSGAKKVVIDGRGYLAVGWVDPGAMEMLGIGTGRIGRSGHGSGRGHSTSPKCAHDVALLAQVGGERAPIGTLTQGTVYEVLSPPPDLEEDLVSIRIETDRLELADGALFLAKKSAFVDCH